MTEPTSPQEGTETGSQQSGTETGPGQNAAPSYSDVLAALTDDQRSAITEEVRKKNSEARTQRDRAKAAEEKAKAYDDAQAAQQTAEQRAQNAQAEAEQRYQQMVGRMVSAEIRAQASDRFADPEDAVAFLDTSSYADDSGEVNTNAIVTDLDDLIERKPHLGKPEPAREAEPASGPRRPAPDRSQGSSANGSTSHANVQTGRDLYRQRHPQGGTTSF